MRTFRTIVAIPFIFALALSTAAFAQERHAVSPAQLAQTTVRHVAQEDADRAAIHEALARPEVSSIAAKAGIDLARVSAAADSLNPDALARAAASARTVNDSLVGGASTITVSTTTIILVLLIVILILVAN
jgi:hypothetical protein